MLNIFFGDMAEAVYNTNVYFKNTCEDEWMEDELSKEMIQDIDHSTVIGPHVIDSPVLGGISPKDLSGGVKTLILINNVNNKIFNASTCGDNCAKWLLYMGDRKDITINLRHIMDFGDSKFTINILNTNEIVHNMKELVIVAGRFVR